MEISHQWIIDYLPCDQQDRANLLHGICYVIGNYSRDKGSENIIDNIFENLWLGNYKAACNYDLIKEKRINCIMNISEIIIPEYDNVNYHYLRITDSDGRYKSLIKQMELFVDILRDELLRGKKVLIHCKQGHHRSASIIVMYLIKYYNINLVDAIRFIKIKRPTALRRLTYMIDNLIDYELDHMSESVLS